MPNHFTLTFFLLRRRDVSCSHSNRVIFTCEDNMLFSRVKISCFRAKAHLVFHWCLYNKKQYFHIGGNNDMEIQASRFFVANRRKQDVKIASCLRSLAIIGDWSGMNVKGVSNYANYLPSSHRKLFATKLRAYGN